MLFNSYFFILVFLPFSIIGYFFLNRTVEKAAILFLLFMSLWFYGYFNYKYLFIIIGSIIVNYILALAMNIKRNKLKKDFMAQKYELGYSNMRRGRGGNRLILSLALLFNLGMIFYFKYYDFFIQNINYAFRSDFNMRHIVLPLGISFFTFQQISYIIDSYHGKTASYTFLEYALFVTFFPQLVAGPIVLHSELIPQIKDPLKKKVNYDNIAKGIMWFTLGLAKKVLIADTLGIAVSWTYGNLDAATSMDLMITALAYTFQIYFDFSGYSDMACGIASMFNFSLPQNFNSPYKSDSIIEFWKRWHITLTRFLREYIYFPLGGSQKGKTRTYFNIMIVFLASGLWHGANWTFVLWGALHGMANIVNRIFDNQYKKIHRVGRWLITFIFLNFTWIFFRSDTVGQAISIIKGIIMMKDWTIHTELYRSFVLPESRVFEKIIEHFSSHITGISMVFILFLCGWISLCFENNGRRLFKIDTASLLFTIILLTWCVLSLGGVSEFLYFNF